MSKRLEQAGHIHMYNGHIKICIFAEMQMKKNTQKMRGKANNAKYC